MAFAVDRLSPTIKLRTEPCRRGQRSVGVLWPPPLFHGRLPQRHAAQTSACVTSSWKQDTHTHTNALRCLEHWKTTMIGKAANMSNHLGRWKQEPARNDAALIKLLFPWNKTRYSCLNTNGPFFFLHPFLFFNPQKKGWDAIFYWLCSKHFWLIRNSESITLMNWSCLPSHLCSAQWRPFVIFAVIYSGKPEDSSSKKALWLMRIAAIINEAAFISSSAPPSTYEQWSPLMVPFVYHRQLFP